MDTPESGGKPHNLELSSLKPLPEKREVGSGVKTPEIPVMDNPSDKVKEQPKPRLKRRMRGVY
jgi:hypothetical protein